MTQIVIAITGGKADISIEGDRNLDKLARIKARLAGMGIDMGELTDAQEVRDQHDHEHTHEAGFMHRNI